MSACAAALLLRGYLCCRGSRISVMGGSAAGGLPRDR